MLLEREVRVTASKKERWREREKNGWKYSDHVFLYNQTAYRRMGQCTG